MASDGVHILQHTSICWLRLALQDALVDVALLMQELPGFLQHAMLALLLHCSCTHTLHSDNGDMMMQSHTVEYASLGELAQDLSADGYLAVRSAGHIS